MNVQRKIKQNYALREVAQNWVVLPLGPEAAHLKGMVTLNNSGAMLWRLLEKGCDLSDLTQALTQRYEVDPEQAQADAREFLETLDQAGCLEPV